MADKNPDFELGEYARGSVLESVELAGAIASGDIGKCLKISGVNSDKLMKVKLATGSQPANFIAIKESVGAVGDLVQVLLRGDVKVTVASAIGPGIAISQKDGEIVAIGTASANGQSHGFARADFADNDTGLICFSGL